jgi:RNA polymerase sigma-70 factor (ECF subfamily)
MSSASAPVAPGTAPEEPPALERARRSATDEAEHAALYARHRGELLAFLVGMTRDPEVAEDLLQEAFLRLVKEARAGRLPQEPRAWLYRVAANAAIDRGRRGSTLARYLPRLFSRDEPEAPEASALRAERDAALHAALARLAPDRRAALLLAARGFTGAETAALLGRSELATRALLCRARLELRGILDPAEVTP